MVWDGTERRYNVAHVPLGRRADDPADARIIWLERHFSSVITAEFGALKDDLAQTFREILHASLGDLPKRVAALEGMVGWRIVWVSSLTSAGTAACVLMWGKMKGWWL